jgi:hypothetical protein
MMEALIKKLAAPFPLSSVGFKPQATNKEKTKAMMVTYIDARAVAERLDEVFPLAWWPEYEVMQHTEDRLVLLCRLHVRLDSYTLTRSDVGESDNDDSEQGKEASRWKSAVSDALKRAAVLYGVGRYVYDLPKPWVEFANGRVTEAGLQKASAEYMKAVKALGLQPPHEGPRHAEARAEAEERQQVSQPTHTSPTLGKDRAEEMHKNLEELGYSRNTHDQLASQVLEKTVRDLSELTETEALEVWSYCKRTSRASARKEAATLESKQLPWQTWKSPSEAKEWAMTLKHKNGDGVFNHYQHAHNGFEEHKKAYLDYCQKKKLEFNIAEVYKAFYEYALDKLKAPMPPLEKNETLEYESLS